MLSDDILSAVNKRELLIILKRFHQILSFFSSKIISIISEKLLFIKKKNISRQRTLLNKNWEMQRKIIGYKLKKIKSLKINLYQKKEVLLLKDNKKI